MYDITINNTAWATYIAQLVTKQTYSCCAYMKILAVETIIKKQMNQALPWKILLYIKDDFYGINWVTI